MDNEILIIVLVAVLLMGVVVALAVGFNVSLLKKSTANETLLMKMARDLRSDALEVNDYYSEILFQSRWAFRLSIGGAIFGLVVITVTLIASWPLSNVNSGTIFGSVTGAVVEAISVFFISRTKNTQENMEKYFEELYRRDMMERIKDERVKDAVRALVATGKRAENKEAVESLLSNVFGKGKDHTQEKS